MAHLAVGAMSGVGGLVGEDDSHQAGESCNSCIMIVQ